MVIVIARLPIALSLFLGLVMAAYNYNLALSHGHPGLYDAGFSGDTTWCINVYRTHNEGVYEHLRCFAVFLELRVHLEAAASVFIIPGRGRRQTDGSSGGRRLRLPFMYSHKKCKNAAVQQIFK